MRKLGKQIRHNWQGMAMASLGILFLLVFHYIPMFGVLIAFKDMDYALNIIKALWREPFVGFENFVKFIESASFRTVMENTLSLNLLKLVLVFPIPIIFALLLNEIKGKKFLRLVQTVTCFPHFVSWTIFGGLIITFLSADGGIFNSILVALGILDQPVNFMTRPEYFWIIMILSEIIKGVGWSSIIYLAAITGVDPQLYEAATLDGANRFQMALHVTLPCIASTIIVMLLLRVGGILGSNFDEFYIFQNTLNLSKSEVLSTYIYKVGVTQRRYSYTTAVGVFQSVIGMILLGISNWVSKKITGNGLY